MITIGKITLNPIFLTKIWNKAKQGDVEPEGDPPANALMDSDGFYLVDKNGKYLTTEE